MASRAESPSLEALGDSIGLNARGRTQLQAGVKTAVYGPFYERMADHALARVRESTLDPQTAVSALGTASRLYVVSDNRYRHNPHALSGEELAEHQRNVLGGKIAVVNPKAATSREFGVVQVIEADSTLSRASQETEAGLAEINYGALFRENTMASATRTLDRSDIEKLLESMDRTKEAMPHLSVSNWAIGQTVAGIYKSLANSHNPGRMRVIDIGSGHGSTVAAITASIANIEDINRQPEIAITALETTPEFYVELNKFADNDASASGLSLERVRHGSRWGGSISEFGAFTTINADAVSAVQNADVSTLANNNDVTVVTANYAFHRLPQSSKTAILEKFSQIPNVVFVIGDLIQNNSDINLRYFNLAANGPLNPGNRRLTKEFARAGYEVADLEREAPSLLDRRIRDRLVRDQKENDGYLWIAFNGQKARDLLDLVDVA